MKQTSNRKKKSSTFLEGQKEKLEKMFDERTKELDNEKKKQIINNIKS